MKTYRSFDTNEIWTEEEIMEEYEGIPELIEQYPNFSEYLEHLLDLGRQRVGGIVEVE